MAFKREVWTVNKEQFVIENYSFMKNKDMAKKLNMKTSQVNSKVQHLKKKGLITNFKKVRALPTKKEPMKPGLNLNSLKLQIGEIYKIDIPRNKNSKLSSIFTGVLIQETDRHITLKYQLGYCESFLKADLLMGTYRIKEC